MSARRHLATSALLLGSATSGCGPTVADARPQWTIVLATDATVPELGDRLLIEVLDAKGDVACPGCRREVGAGDPGAWPVSFGLVPGGKVAMVRGRLYRAADTGADGLPGSALIIDATGKLPSAEGATKVPLVLSMACFGVVGDPAKSSTCDPKTGALAAIPTLPTITDDAALPRPGTWGPARPVPCKAAPPPGMKCVPGGAFLLGNSHAFNPTEDLYPRPEHLVHLSPFALDEREVTVGDMEALVAEGVPAPIKQSPDPTKVEHFCTYVSASDQMSNGMPLNCVDFALAQKICEKQGKRLPSEAEWEYAAGNLGRETPFPWGEDSDACANAIVGRGFAGGIGITSCRNDTTPGGPVAGGSAADVTELGLHDMGGNMNEWCADTFSPYTAPCWNGASVLEDPVCAAAGAPGHSIRGGSWDFYPYAAHPYTRDVSVKDGPAPSTGVRCAVSM